ncbi:MAG TPA: nucleoside-diphosphate kinase [Armatimonadota bacterium]|nr:nucleoside-diphosphate kinase [Armatimonadota bacterium]
MVREELEQTLVLIKPDALKNSLTGYILSQLSEFHTGLRFAGAKVVHVTRLLAEEHYAEHRAKVFFESLLEYLQGKLHYPDEPHKQRVIAIVYQGRNAIAGMRDVVGPTNPHQARDARPGSIRALGTVVPITDEGGEVIGTRLDNLIHASANPADAEREIKLWFKPTDIPPSMRIFPTAACDTHFYYRDQRVYTTYTTGSICLAAPGDVLWDTDLEVLELVCRGADAPYSLGAVAAKYLTNLTEEE